MTSHPHVAVAICTLDRHLGLTMLLEAIDRQDIGAWPDHAVTVLVVDNSASGSVRALCTVRAEASRFRLVHVHEARRGLSFARNAALAASHDIGASHVAFVDDDEVPDPQWLSALHARLVETGATAAVGPVRPIFEDHPPRWAVAGGFFAKILDARDRYLTDAYTCNVMVEMATVTRHHLAFEPRFNSTGGEDTFFFKALRASGGRIAWAADAMVHEYMPAARVKPTWLMKRWFRTGGTEAELGRYGNASAFGRSYNAVRGGARVFGGSGRAILSVLTTPMRAERHLLALYTVCRGAGLIAAACGRTYSEYAAATYRSGEARTAKKLA